MCTSVYIHKASGILLTEQKKYERCLGTAETITCFLSRLHQSHSSVSHYALEDFQHLRHGYTEWHHNYRIKDVLRLNE